MPSQLPVHASQLYARNVADLLALMTSDGMVQPDFGDEIVAGCALTSGGEVRHAGTRTLLETASGNEGS